ncbi:hypothetical protein OSB04_027384 [Centaurea solstitialis]|uniref:Uncharacterized protein n=1 Tax=Centaurea solstitialis TaxID=347529 RepID=A0AA38SYQ1_9ASTR|nr:hypothetical protein OSB04_027384 [Centaurea solstitialis]
MVKVVDSALKRIPILGSVQSHCHSEFELSSSTCSSSFVDKMHVESQIDHFKHYRDDRFYLSADVDEMHIFNFDNMRYSPSQEVCSLTSHGCLLIPQGKWELQREVLQLFDKMHVESLNEVVSKRDYKC